MKSGQGWLYSVFRRRLDANLQYLYVEVSSTGANFPFWIKQNGAILAQTQVCRSKPEVAHVLRNYLRGLWRKGHISGHEKMLINDREVAEIWDLNRFRNPVIQSMLALRVPRRAGWRW